MIERWRRRWAERRVEILSIRLNDAEDWQSNRELFQRNHGGFNMDIRNAARRVVRLARKLEKAKDRLEALTR
jgi:hypothetical protein